MQRFLLPISMVLFALGCGEATTDTNRFEVSPPAAAVAGETPGMQLPSTFGFGGQPETASLPGYPQWYCPKSVVTRAQMASFVARTMYGSTNPSDAMKQRFSDVSVNNVHAAAINRIAADGISDGCGEGAFCPGHAVTRGQMATFAVRMMNGPDATPPEPAGDVFLDVDASHPHAGAIEMLASGGFDAGCGLGRYCPDDAITRDEIATFVVYAKYGDVPSSGSSRTFLDVADDNAHRDAIEVLTRDGVTSGCEAPVVGYRVEGYPLTDRQRNWLLYFVGRWLPKLSAAYGDRARARQVAARVIWWSLRRSVFGEFGDPFGHSICQTDNGLRHLGPFETCDPGAVWEVGPSAVIVPQATDDEIREAMSAIYPGRSNEELAAELVDLGRSVALVGGAGEYPEWAEDRVLNDNYLLRSWLARDPAIGAWVIIDDIERNCVDAWEMQCGSVGESEGRHFGTDPQSAAAVQDELERILEDLRPR